MEEGSKGTRAPRLEVIADALRRKRLERALTQMDLAATAEVDASVVSYLERGRGPVRATTVSKLARALDCDPMEIARVVYDGLGSPHAPPGSTSRESSVQ